MGTFMPPCYTKLLQLLSEFRDKSAVISLEALKKSSDSNVRFCLATGGA